MKYIILILIMLTACVTPGEKEVNSSNSDFKVELLFTVDGCKVYRFHDGGNSRYFSTCKGSSTSWNESCGKNCSRSMLISTN